MGDAERAGPESAGGVAARRRLLDLLGLAARAGAVVTGIDAVRRAAREGRIHRVVLAEDAADGQVRKLTPLLDARRVPFHTLYTRNDLAAALGRDSVSALGLTDVRFAQRAGELVVAVTGTRAPAEPERGSPAGPSKED